MTVEKSRLPIRQGLSLGELVGRLNLGIPSREIVWIAEKCLGRDDLTWAHLAEEIPTAKQAAEFVETLNRRLSGEPLQYCLGTWQFRSLELCVDPSVLIPRPETELLVDISVATLRECINRYGGCLSADSPGEPERRVRVLDLGTGSGAIALAIAWEFRLTRDLLSVLGVDLSQPAIEVAEKNYNFLVEQYPDFGSVVRFLQGSWYDSLGIRDEASFDLIVSNPPYISIQDYLELDPQVRDFEPELALVAGQEGTECLEQVIYGAQRWLKPGGTLACEIGERQGPQVLAMARSVGLERVGIRKDLAGRDRYLVGSRPRSSES